MKFEIGDGSSILLGCTMDTRKQLAVGEKSTINQNCRIDNRGTVKIGDRVSISAETIILTADHDIQSGDFAGRHGPVEIEDYVFIGTRALILPGVKIGKGGVVAAGAVVTKSVAPYEIVAGTPAKRIGQRNTDLTYDPSYRRFLN